MALSNLPLLCLVGAGLCAIVLAQGGPPVRTSCETYKKLAESTKSNSRDMPTSKTQNLRAILPNGPSEDILIETPSRSTWMPQCRKDGSYEPLQTRVNGQKFCVYHTTGEILLDPSLTAKNRQVPLRNPIQCDCLDQRKAFSGISFRGAPDSAKPVCQESTGAWISKKP